MLCDCWYGKRQALSMVVVHTCTLHGKCHYHNLNTCNFSCYKFRIIMNLLGWKRAHTVSEWNQHNEKCQCHLCHRAHCHERTRYNTEKKNCLVLFRRFFFSFLFHLHDVFAHLNTQFAYSHIRRKLPELREKWSKYVDENILAVMVDTLILTLLVSHWMIKNKWRNEKKKKKIHVGQAHNKIYMLNVFNVLQIIDR